MSYSEFTLESVNRQFGVITQDGAIFPDAPVPTIPVWLPQSLARGTRLAFLSEKARSEFIVAPILLAARELSGDQFAIYSGQRLDVDSHQGLMGECDFILALGPAVPPLYAPVMTIVEAKKNDIEGGLGQCLAQMVAARKFNEDSGRANSPCYGCVTTGETWQFLRLTDHIATLHHDRLYLDNLAGILSALHAIYQIAASAESIHRLSA